MRNIPAEIGNKTPIDFILNTNARITIEVIGFVIRLW
jgi:hypothetical protein